MLGLISFKFIKLDRVFNKIENGSFVFFIRPLNNISQIQQLFASSLLILNLSAEINLHNSSSFTYAIASFGDTVKYKAAISPCLFFATYAQIRNENNLKYLEHPFDAGISDLLGLLEQKISDISNVSSVMYGNIENEKRTATELNLADKGSTAQSSKMLDIIYQDLTIPTIKNIAEILAMFKPDNEFVYAQEKGINTEYKITPEIRQAEYQYYYEDRNALFDYNNRIKELYQICQGAFQLPELAQQLDSKEIFTMLVETLHIDNVEKLFKDMSPAQQLGDMVKSLPQEVQGQIVPAFTQQIQQYMQNLQQNQLMQQMQQEAQQQVQMEQMKDNARMQAEVGTMPLG